MGKVPIVSVKVPIVSVKQLEKSPVRTRLKSDEIPFTLRETILLYHGRRLDMIPRYGRQITVNLLSNCTAFPVFRQISRER
jgi:hypothetical protein